jgi:hypothetical protein
VIAPSSTVHRPGSALASGDNIRSVSAQALTVSFGGAFHTAIAVRIAAATAGPLGKRSLNPGVGEFVTCLIDCIRQDVPDFGA